MRNLIPLWLRIGAGLAKPLRILPRRKPALLVVRPGSFGDALLFTGALRALRKQYPDHRVVLVASRRAVPIFDRSPYIDNLLWFDEETSSDAGIYQRLGRICFAMRIIGCRYACAVDAASSGMNFIDSDWFKMLLAEVEAEEKIALDDKDAANGKSSELDLLVLLLQKAGCGQVQSSKDIWPEIYLHADERAWARGIIVEICNHKDRKEHKEGKFLTTESTDDTEVEKKDGKTSETGLRAEVCGLQSNLFLALCPGARFKQKDWGAEKYAELIRRMAVEVAPRRLVTLLLGGPEDWEKGERIKQNVERRMWDVERGNEEADGRPRTKDQGLRTKDQEPKIVNLCGELSIFESMAVIEQSDLCVGNDTFGLHAAIAVGTSSVVVMWGGDGDRWAPWGDPARHRMARADVDCAGCGGDCSRPRYECMEQITPEMVMEEILKIGIFAELRDYLNRSP